ncbi:Hypothetical Protein FCC1311_099272 [Hondaea fermentalgiana]|uniref:Uncharacterized protein n=1 Tax=Hondaea fermentalgiana TaxID=2315210 RepID=A0A2R5H068_9STRA|nr:Hypothetical Protein FCC1311_099272 [Hondaea fermentalgiana]|eukprot:GBG33704.1 Hypothetical Protein FCC1311_099272 [Hondaea fermentalgiana]
MATPSESERGGPDASRLPLEIDFTDWDDVVFRNLQPSDVKSQRASTGSVQSEPAVSVNALEGMMRSRKLPWTIPLGRPMFNAITGVPGQDTSGVHSWGVQVLELAKWGNFEDYDLSQAIGQDATFDAAAFLPGAAFDRSQSETGCAMQMFARSGDPLLKHVFSDLQAFSSLHMDIKFESYTVVGRPETTSDMGIWVGAVGDTGSERIAAARNRGIGFARALATAVDAGLSNAGASLRSTSGNDSREYVHNGTKDALEQIYGYMIALGLRYGALSTTEYTWFLKREEWQGSDENREPITPRLLVSKAYSCTGEGTKSVHMGYLIALCRALEDREARNQFPRKDSQLGQHVISEWRNGLRGNNGTQIQRRNPYDDAVYEYFKGIRDTEPGAPGDDVLLPLPRNAMADLLPVPWDKAYESVRESSTSSVKRLRRPDGLAFMIKTLVTGGRMGGLSVDEARSTDIAVPSLVYGGTLMDECNWFAVITLDVGTSLQEVGAPFAAEVREGALAALARVHAAGCLHGDVALRNFVLCPETGAVRVIDFARARLVKPESAEAKQGTEAEMHELRERLGGGIPDRQQQSGATGASSSTTTRDLA